LEILADTLAKIQFNSHLKGVDKEATYNRPNVPNLSENIAFKTSATEIFPESIMNIGVYYQYILYNLLKVRFDARMCIVWWRQTLLSINIPGRDSGCAYCQPFLNQT